MRGAAQVAATAGQHRVFRQNAQRQIHAVPLCLTSDHEASSSEVFSCRCSFRNLKKNHDTLQRASVTEGQHCVITALTKATFKQAAFLTYGNSLQKDSISEGFLLSFVEYFPKRCFNSITHYWHYILEVLGE